jgi:hypothetical protein
MVWRVNHVAERRPGEVTETEVARIERDEQAGSADLAGGGRVYGKNRHRSLARS